MPSTFNTEQWLPYPRELVFAFFANPENLPRLMPTWQKARIEEAIFAPPPPRPEGAPSYPGLVAGNGTRLTISARPFPFAPVRAPWDALILDFRWNEGFCDVQTRGPFKSWKHCHSVRSEDSPTTGQPGTIVRDEVVYELPLGRFNSLADALVARHGFDYIFGYRQKRTAEMLARMAGRPL